jgi:serine/threonine protein kinase
MAAPPSSSSDEQFAIGSVLDGRYRIEAVLGTGGMGRVYRAEHTKIGKSVAIKVLHADLHRNREASQRFQREAIASGRLDHPNIVGVSDFGVLDGGACYLVMEVLEGESLGDRLMRDKRIHWVEAIDILRGVLYGLRHAHERGVVHRDIKPDNVYLARKDGDPVIKILDFGIAKLYAGTADDPASTRAGLTVGTPAYLSPEQACGGEITPKSDLYSASIVLYEMLAGRAPFEDKDPLAMLGAHVSRRPPLFADVAPGVDIPRPLEDIVQHGLKKSAADRIGTATDYLALLDAFSPPLHPMPRMGTSLELEAASARIRLPASTAQSSREAVPQHSDAVQAAWEAARGQSETVDAPRSSGRGGTTPLPASAPLPVVSAAVPAAASPAHPEVSSPAPAARTATQVPSASGALHAAAVSLEMAPLPRALRAVSLAEVTEPIPLTWIVRSGVVIGLAIAVAIVLAIATHCRGSEPRPTARAAAGSGERAAAGSGSGSRPPVAIGAPGAKPLERDAQLKQALRDLESGKTCRARRAAIGKLVELGDPSAIQNLRRALARGGPGDEGNACLRADGEQAIKDLTALK